MQDKGVAVEGEVGGLNLRGLARPAVDGQLTEIAALGEPLTPLELVKGSIRRVDQHPKPPGWRRAADARGRSSWRAEYGDEMTLDERVERLERIAIQLQYLTLLHGDFFKGKDEKNSIETLGELIAQIADEHGLSSAET
jgi:hypothetical protein